MAEIQNRWAALEGSKGDSYSNNNYNNNSNYNNSSNTNNSNNKGSRKTFSTAVSGANTEATTAESTGKAFSTNLKVVEIEALVLIKILKHCRENFPTPVNGQLLGMDTHQTLEVTNCFPLPQKKDVYQSIQKLSQEQGNNLYIDDKVEEEFESYQDRMAELMHDLSVDCFTVGWYQTLSFGDIKNKDNIDSLVLYQELVDKAVMLGFDPILNSMGRMAFKAYRASDEFLAVYHSAEQDVAKYSKLQGKDILLEVPIVIKNSLLLEAYLQDWAIDDPEQNRADFNAMEIDQNNYLEKNLNFLSDCLEDLGLEQEKIVKFQRDRVKQQQLEKQVSERKRLENEQRRLRGETLLPEDSIHERKMDAPTQIHTLLMSTQASIQCSEINDISAENLAKLYLLSRGTNVPTVA